ncbi:hypothetical protein BZA77DRAFT_341950 [Pyronema omphalodes]|nr:hypothetical protein BZA77DRAFT_341950 [Pyronema omphalodes]
MVSRNTIQNHNPTQPNPTHAKLNPCQTTTSQPAYIPESMVRLSQHINHESEFPFIPICASGSLELHSNRYSHSHPLCRYRHSKIPKSPNPKPQIPKPPNPQNPAYTASAVTVNYVHTYLSTVSDKQQAYMLPDTGRIPPMYLHSKRNFITTSTTSTTSTSQPYGPYLHCIHGKIHHDDGWALWFISLRVSGKRRYGVLSAMSRVFSDDMEGGGWGWGV